MSTMLIEFNFVLCQSVAHLNLISALHTCVLALPEGFPVVREITNTTVTVIEKGFPMTLRCRITGDPMPEVIWYRNKSPVDVHSSNRVRVVNRHGVSGSKFILLQL